MPQLPYLRHFRKRFVQFKKECKATCIILHYPANLARFVQRPALSCIKLQLFAQFLPNEKSPPDGQSEGLLPWKEV